MMHNTNEDKLFDELKETRINETEDFSWMATYPDGSVHYLPSEDFKTEKKVREEFDLGPEVKVEKVKPEAAH